MLAYPGMTALNPAGAQYMCARFMGATVKVAAKTLDPVLNDTGLRSLPDITLDEAVTAPDILIVSGAYHPIASADVHPFQCTARRNSATRINLPSCLAQMNAAIFRSDGRIWSIDISRDVTPRGGAHVANASMYCRKWHSRAALSEEPSRRVVRGPDVTRSGARLACRWPSWQLH